jgi:hypothetical protein
MNTEIPNRGPNPTQMKALGLRISLMMALLMSFSLSVFGTATAERPAEMPLAPILIGWLGSFLLSFVVSFAIGFVVPMGKVNAALGRKFHLQPRKLTTHLVESMVANLIYTPLMTAVMVVFAYFVLIPAGQKPPFLPMFVGSQIACFVVGYVLIFVATPFIVKIAMKQVEKRRWIF